MRKIRGVILLLAVALSIVSIQAQDNHYSWMQYGSRNSILYNAGLSRFEDQSAVIMNPATLADALQSSFNFNTNVVSFNKIKFEDGLGKGFTVKNDNLNVLPSMASGVWKPKNEQKKWTLGYALYHANTDVLDFSDRSERREDLLVETEGPGDEYYLAQYNLENKMDEFTTVIGLGWKLSENWSFGASQSFTYRNQDYREAFSAFVITDPALNAPVDLVGSNQDYTVKYSTLMTHTKLGLQYKGKKWDLGFTVSSPTFRIFGTGKILADLSLTNVRLSPIQTVPRSNFLANGQIEDLKAKYKYPLNASLGASRQFGNLRLYGAVQWYGAIDRYSVVDPGDASFIQPPSANNVLYTSQVLSVWSSNKSVINGSVAADWLLKSGNHFLLSFRTDNHYAEFDKNIDGNNLAVKQWDNYHLTIGTQREMKSSVWVVGVRFNYGVNKEFPQPASFKDPSEGNFLQGDRQTGKITSTGIQLMLSYTFKFGNKAGN
ncbi:MAG TPA: hypothetical protein VK166_06905 [Chitinophagaceae bacterium]|nr:hypothetical protein [Chitinophagaceae bacterium]